MRRKYPFMGKARIHAMLARKGSRLSVSTVGRIIECALVRGAIPRASLCEGRLKPRRRRSFNNRARRWRCGAKAGSPGELVRIDHMTHTRDGKALKEFRAIRPATKFMVSRVRSRATARSAGRFLDEALAAFPFAVSSVQVDGGSEFMAEFEDACAKLGIQLHVPPPRRPQWNGCVERASRSARSSSGAAAAAPDRRRGRQGPRRIRVPPQLRAPPRIARMPNPERVPCRLGGGLIELRRKY